MNTLTSGKPFTIDPDYEAFSGRVVHTCSTSYYDPKAKAWIKRTVEYIDVGRADSVEPVDVDEAMTPDPWPQETNNSEAARQANMRRKAARDAKMRAEIVAYLKRFGPSRAANIAYETGCKNSTLFYHLTQEEGETYVKVKTIGRAAIWGLVGIHDREAA